MSTFAHYRVWVGVRLSDIQLVGNDKVDEILQSIDFVQIDGLPFNAFGMHGETVGIGVEILDFEWETVETGPSEFDAKLCDKATSLVPKVTEALRSIGISISAKIYHHIDLGG